MKLATCAMMVVLVAATAFAVSTSNVRPANVRPEKDEMVSPVMPAFDRQGGEDIGSAAPIASIPFSDSGTTAGYVNDYDEVCPYTGSTSPDVVYSYYAAEDICVSISLCNSFYDTKVYVYEDAVGNVPQYGCNDDNDDCVSPPVSYTSWIPNVWLYAGHMYYIVVDGYGGQSGNYVIDVTEVEWWPPLNCPPDGTDEGEGPCYDGYVDNYNGGCNSTPNVFQNIAFPETICGTSGVYMFGTSTYRDTDWFQFTLSVAKTVSLSVCAAFPPIVGYIDLSLGCPVTAFYAYTTGAAYNPVTLTYALPAGTWVAFVAPADWGAYPCGVNYVATLWEEGTTPVEEKSWGTVKALYR